MRQGFFDWHATHRSGDGQITVTVKQPQAPNFNDTTHAISLQFTGSFFDVLFNLVLAGHLPVRDCLITSPLPTTARSHHDTVHSPGVQPDGCRAIIFWQGLSLISAVCLETTPYWSVLGAKGSLLLVRGSSLPGRHMRLTRIPCI
jgi:hypothetical protein